MLLRALILINILLISSCSLAPFAPNTSGRSYGPGNMQAEFGNANSNYFLKIGAGLSKDLDVGYIMEFGASSTSGIFLKYSFLNQKTGPSLAMELGYGGTETTTYYTGGVIGSLAFNKNFELFVNPRVNSVETDETDVTLGDSIGSIVVNDYNVTYLQVNYGLSIWFSENVGLSIYSIWFKGENIETTAAQTAGATMLFNF